MASVVRRGPQRLWIARHGESAGNVALMAAEAEGRHWIELAHRDADVPLSPRGERQAAALGRWFAAQPTQEQPTLVISSPYVRAHTTAQIVIQHAGLSGVPLLVDERLREKEFGVLNRMTKAGIAALMPDQAALRQAIGKFYYRPPGGESWCDILLRLRHLWSTLQQEHENERVLLVCHSVVTLCYRCIIERLSEQQVLDIDRAHDVANCSLTSYVPAADSGTNFRWQLQHFNFVAPMEEAGETVTSAPDAPLPK
ncbi:MAG: histidine phosphatase family protein [Deltaproteobacteria bacterium]|nr:histidine phosphatase family protein [Deltaproteobacteria bacterium]